MDIAKATMARQAARRSSPRKLDGLLENLDERLREQLISVLNDAQYNSEAIAATLREDLGFDISSRAIQRYRKEVLQL